MCEKWLGSYYIIAENQYNMYNLRHCNDTCNTELGSAAHADDQIIFYDPEIRPTTGLNPLLEDDV